MRGEWAMFKGKLAALVPVADSRPPCRTCRAELNLRGDTDAVSDVVGTVLLIAITVIMSTVMAGLLFAFKGPVATPQANLSVSVNPGTSAWGTGDEQIIVTHVGGDALIGGDTRITYKINQGAAVVVAGSSTTPCASQAQPKSILCSLYDGSTALPLQTQWGIGKSYVRTLTLQASDIVTVNVVGTGGASTLLATARLIPGQVAAGSSCPFDTAAPTVSTWTQNPSDVSTVTLGALPITAALTDDCAGVDPAVTPHLFYRFNPGNNPAYTDGGAMTLQGTNVWAASIPDPAWASKIGQTLQYYVGPLSDLGGHTANSVTQSDVVQLSCPSDTNAPTVNTWVQTPTDLTVRASGAVTVQATVGDDCWGVNTLATPQLWYCISSTPPCTTGTMTQAAAMTGTNPWSGSIPEPANKWCSVVGQTLEYELRGLTDSAPVSPNVGTSARRSDVVQAHCTYVASTGASPVGVFSASPNDFPKAQSGTDAGAFATITEAGTTTTTQTSGGLGVTAAAIGSTTNVGNSLASDNARATISAVGAGVDVTGFTIPAGGTGTIRSISIGVEASESSSGTPNPVLLLAYKVGGVQGPTTQSVTLSSTTDAATALDVTNDRNWLPSDVNSNALHVIVTATTLTTHNALVDQLYILVTYTSGVSTRYAMNVRMDWTGVVADGSQDIQLSYKTTGDTYTVQVWDPVAGVFNTRGAVLNSASLASWTYSMTAQEFAAGAPRLRFLDVTPGGGTQGTLSLDYARVAGS